MSGDDPKCLIHWAQFNEINKALSALLGAGFSKGSGPFNSLWTERLKVLSSLGKIRPKMTLALGQKSGLSPGLLRAWFDTEYGWLAEARPYPAADPIYHVVAAEDAIAIIKGDVSRELEERLMTPSEYEGEE